ncbi:MAG: hypothetical protein KF716_06245 [Anaerolineae bacterium]|nr:hypothetical protein [Anaerolineae bacterium]
MQVTHLFDRIYQVVDEQSGYGVRVDDKHVTVSAPTLSPPAAVTLDGIEKAVQWGRVILTMLHEGAMPINTETVRARLSQSMEKN